MRLDPVEYGWLLTITLIVHPSFSISLILLIWKGFTDELCAIADENREDSCLMQIPTLLFSLARLIRVMDLLALLLL